MNAMTDEQREPEPVTERWAYAGQCPTRTGLAEAWATDAGNGDEVAYTGRGKHIIGALYDVRVSRVDKRVIRHGTPGYTGERLPHDDDRVRRWAVRDNAARIGQQQRQAEAKDAKRDTIDHAIEPLMTLANACRTRVERDALLATVIRRITTGR